MSGKKFTYTENKHVIGGNMYFENRAAAARKLAEALSEYRGKNLLVLAIPRGAVPMAKIIADELEGKIREKIKELQAWSQIKSQISQIKWISQIMILPGHSPGNLFPGMKCLSLTGKLLNAIITGYNLRNHLNP